MSFILISIILVFTRLSSVENASPRLDPIVAIDQGIVKGVLDIDGDYSKFLGIPYAKVDPNNPFGPPLAAPEFEEIFEANDGSIVCPQNGLSGEFQGRLDCLYLNIYVPNRASSSNPLSVVVWIHGGGFTNGGPEDLTSYIDNDIIVVSLNYRLGVYGFMCLDTATVPGNRGLKDQHLAIQWVKANIAAFGGDASNIVLAGQSAGAGSIDLHLYSPYEKIFSKVIMQSGTAHVEGMFINQDVTAALNIAHYLGYQTNDTDEAVNFLATVDPELLVGTVVDTGYWFRPCKEREIESVERFVTDDPFHLHNSVKVKNIPVLIGYNSIEEYYIANENDAFFSSLGDPFLDKIKANFDFQDEEQLITLAKIIRHFYIGDADITAALALDLVDFECDFVFNHAIERAITNQLESEAGSIYFYVFGFTTSNNKGATHGEEMKFFSNEVFEENVKAALVKKRLNTMWSNFVKYGNPTPEVNEDIPVIWSAVTKDKRHVLYIDENLNLVDHVYRKRMSFWDLIFDVYKTQHIKYNAF